jgi:ribosomal-protein-alanine N-acetyltransferase
MTTQILSYPGEVDTLAAYHAAAFAEAWSADWIGRLMAQPGTFAIRSEGGFILIRSAGGEAEVLTLAVAPAARRRGIATALILAASRYAQKQGARKLLLEVGRANEPAKSLYARLGFREVACRKGYYQGGEGEREDALVMAVELPLVVVGNVAKFD